MFISLYAYFIVNQVISPSGPDALFIKFHDKIAFYYKLR
jgi:hypothetical protein